MKTLPIGDPKDEKTFIGPMISADEASRLDRWIQEAAAAGATILVTNMARPAENVVAFYNKRGTCEQWIKEGKGAIKWTRLSCRSFAANAADDKQVHS